MGELSKRGYTNHCFLLDASAYGLPQTRLRIYIVSLLVCDPAIAISAREFFESMKVLLQKTSFAAPNVEHCLIEGRLFIHFLFMFFFVGFCEFDCLMVFCGWPGILSSAR